ncbi:hypothetical protein ETJ91_00555 [Bacillus albus]|nr:HNH endonuclease [Bacillus albus]RXJ19889.1 hypothetical protein ETJ91_00555 [Bacillus albus]RXJ30034.1 hypothetical protein ETJ76_15535 [Bacillus albus]RXJ31626.1 hypothetical protein ETJ90_08310 [Bacillus albus]RXJ42850.1 hypothetical protein ETJ89_08315 [Bacillus albus]RXJ59778.1 hypothetical protein ETJ66_08310 [Bacillus albus]
MRWKDVVDYEGGYKVSTCGKVFSVRRNRCLKSYINKHGYEVCALSRNCKVKHIAVHRLVAKAFIPNPAGKPQVNHKDGNKTNNDISNLEWVTASENIKHAHVTGLSRFTADRLERQGEWFKKKVAQIADDGSVILVFESEIEACKHFGFHKGTIGRYINGLRSNKSGLNFKYI